MKITQANIPKEALVKSVTNKSGGSLAEGDVVIWDEDNDNAVALAASRGDEQVAGVVNVGGADNAFITIITHGYAAKVLTDLAEGVGRGYYIFTETASKYAMTSAYEGPGNFGIALTHADVNGYVSAIIGLQSENY